MASSNGNIFRITGPLCREITGHRWIPSQRSVTRSFGVFFDLRLNKRLSKQSGRHCNGTPALLCFVNRFIMFIHSAKLWVMCGKGKKKQSIKYTEIILFLTKNMFLTFYTWNPMLMKYVYYSSRHTHISVYTTPEKLSLCCAKFWAFRSKHSHRGDTTL